MARAEKEMRFGGSSPSQTPSKRISCMYGLWTVILFLGSCAVAFAYPLVWYGRHLKEQYFLAADYAHQMSLLSWMYRVWTQDAGPFLSPDFFYPYQGILATSEVPLFHGVIYTVIRWSTGEPFLAWHLTFALMVALTAAAAFWAVRNEGFSAEAACIVSLFFSLGAGLEALGDSINYRAAFGIPLAWLVLSRIRDSRRSKPWLYGSLFAVLLLQFSAGATNTLAALIVIGCRLALEPRLRRGEIWLGCALALFLIADLGMTWGQASHHYVTRLGIDSRHFIPTQNKFHVDLANFFLPPALRGTFTVDPRWNWWPEVRRWAPSVHSGISILLLLGLGFALWDRRARSWGGNQQIQIPLETKQFKSVFILSGLLISLVFLWGWLPQHLGSLRLPRGLLWSTSIALIAVVGFLYGIRLPERIKTAGPPLSWFLTALVPLSLSFGPIVFVFGKPLFLGPAAFADALFPGFERIRFLGRLWPATALPLGFIAAQALDGLFSRLKIGAAFAGVIVLWSAGTTAVERLTWTVPDRVLAFPKEACPDCGDDFRIQPLPYRWLQEHAPGEPLLELPTGFGNPPGKNEAPLHGHDVVYLTEYVLDGIPRLNGVTSWPPSAHAKFIDVMGRFPDPEALERIRARGTKWILVHGNRYAPEQWEILEKRLNPPPVGFSIVKRWGPVWLLKVE